MKTVVVLFAAVVIVSAVVAPSATAAGPPDDDAGWSETTRDIQARVTLVERPAVNGTTRIATREGLLTLARDWGEQPGVILQEYLPREEAEDWIVHACFDADSSPLALFTGVKVRSWPPHAAASTTWSCRASRITRTWRTPSLPSSDGTSRCSRTRAASRSSTTCAQEPAR